MYTFKLYKTIFFHCDDFISGELFIASITSFIGGVFLVISFISPYWLQSWEETQSPFKNMGLWEFCFYKFRHPDYQFDHLFHGCHALYGDEYRLIREKLMPGWLMVVQLFVSLTLILAILGLLVIVSLLLRCPLEWILRFEHPISMIVWGLNAFSGTPSCNFFVTKFILMDFFTQLLYCFSLSASLDPNAGTVIGSYTPTTILSPGVLLLLYSLASSTSFLLLS